MKLTSEEQATTEMQAPRVAIVDGCETTSRAMYYRIERDWDSDARHGDGRRCRIFHPDRAVGSTAMYRPARRRSQGG